MANADDGESFDFESEMTVPPHVEVPVKLVQASGNSSVRSSGQSSSGDGGDCRVVPAFYCDPVMCINCGKKRYTKAKFCKECKEDHAASKRDAEMADESEEWLEAQKTQEALCSLLRIYKTKCHSRGRGTPRDAFDWVSYKRILYCSKQLTRGVEQLGLMLNCLA